MVVLLTQFEMSAALSRAVGVVASERAIEEIHSEIRASQEPTEAHRPIEIVRREPSPLGQGKR